MAEKIAILASGEGTTAEALIQSTVSDKFDFEVGLVISNNADAGVFECVAHLNQQFGLGITTKHINGETHPGEGGKGEQTLEESSAILELVEEDKFGLVLLLGYMRRVRGPMLDNGPTILNTHPGPLPETAGMYRGLAIQGHVIDTGLEYAAQTLHIVDAGYDTGPVVAVNRVKVQSSHTPQLLLDDVRATEKLHLPCDVQAYLNTR